MVTEEGRLPNIRDRLSSSLLNNCSSRCRLVHLLFTRDPLNNHTTKQAILYAKWSHQMEQFFAVLFTAIPAFNVQRFCFSTRVFFASYYKELFYALVLIVFFFLGTRLPVSCLYPCERRVRSQGVIIGTYALENAIFSEAHVSFKYSVNNIVLQK